MRLLLVLLTLGVVCVLPGTAHAFKLESRTFPNFVLFQSLTLDEVSWKQVRASGRGPYRTFVSLHLFPGKAVRYAIGPVPVSIDKVMEAANGSLPRGAPFVQLKIEF